VLEFAELARKRTELRESTINHVPSVMFFNNAVDRSFFKTTEDVERGDPGDGGLHGITTTFTCVESLFDADGDGPDHAAAILAAFVPHALAAPGQWESEGAAKVYCRVRALAPLLQYYEGLTDEQRETVQSLVAEAWTPVSLEPGKDAVYEVDTNTGDKSRYPPNAYLTYFGLAALEKIGSDAVQDGTAKQLIAESWLEKTLATQVTLHYAGSHLADPQQLAWAICGVARFREHVLVNRTPPTGDLVEAGLKAFFDQQVGGTWPRGEPLFHYPEAGNAYCYAFETLAELLHLAVDDTPRAVAMRRMLAPYGDHLVASFRHVSTTSRPLGVGRLEGWSSGHHPHRAVPESWATACVFKFLQCARKLFGIWTRDEAARLLGARQPRGDRKTFTTVGDTWDAGQGAAGTQLSSLFVHPLLARPANPNPYDPDEAVIDDKAARSAILFGPPGTGKTTLVEAVAGRLGWDFVEITPALFLDRGVELVSARADEVFRQIMELDQCVVLFDEIDELIRVRDQRSDPLERFFTTTMLPRLSKLWAQRKVLFFVNTNGIGEVDPAIRRSSRFDAAIFVLPPSFESKQALLAEDEAKVHLDTTRENIYKLLDGAATGVAEDAHDIAWLAFVRHDQLSRLAARLRSVADDPAHVDDLTLAGVLTDFGKELMAADWLDPTMKSAEMTRQHVIGRFAELANEQRVDHGRRRVVETFLTIDPPPGVTILKTPVDEEPGFWQIDVVESNLQTWAMANGLRLDGGGRLEQV
jgi:predicted ATPase